jgi:hypothetical protein
MAIGVYDLYANKTFVVFKGHDGDPYAVAINHTNNQISSPVKAGIIQLEKGDTHNYPQICQSDDGYLHVFFADRYSTVIRYSRSKKPHSIDEWEEGPTVYRGDYPMLFKALNGNMYLFYRKNLQNNIDYYEDGSFPYRHQYYVKSTDNGKTWSDPKQALIRWDKSDHMNEFYLGNMVKEPPRPGVPERWHFAYVLSGGEIHDQYQQDLYHAYFCPEDDHFYNVTGTDLGEYIDQAEMENHCLVFKYGPTTVKSYVNPVSVDDQGIPRISMYFKWTGQEWVTYQANGLGDEMTYYEWVNGKMYAYGGGVHVYASPDKGDNWAEEAYYVPPDFVSGAGRQTVPVTQPSHPGAKLWSKETSNKGVINNVTIGGHTSSNTPKKLIITADPVRLKTQSINTVQVYVCDEYNARVINSTATVTCSIEGGGTLYYSTVAAVQGMATFYYKAGTGEENIMITATSNNMSDASLRILVRNDGIETGIIGDTIQIPTSATLNVSPASRQVASTSGTTTFAVTSNIDWSASESSDWVTAVKTDAATLTVSYNENTDADARSATITLSGIGVTSENVTVNQTGALATLSVSPASRPVTSASGTTTFTVTSNTDWSVSESSSWLTAVKTNATTLTVSYDENKSLDARSATITLSGTGVTSQLVAIEQSGATPTLIDEVNTGSTDIKLSVFPNPFHDFTRIVFTVPQNGMVNIDLYDMEGRLVNTLIKKHYSAGNHEIILSKDNLNNGIYFCRISFNNLNKMIKVVIN